MKTIEEIKECAKNYPSYANFKTVDVDRVSFENVVKELKDDEEVLIAFPSGLGHTGSTRGINMAVVITNKRLIVDGKTDSMLFSRPFLQSIKLDKVNSVGTDGILIRINTIGDEDCSFGGFHEDVRGALSREIERIIDEFHTNSKMINVVQQDSIPDQIKKYKALLDQGILTAEEFDAKKKQLLGL